MPRLLSQRKSGGSASGSDPDDDRRAYLGFRVSTRRVVLQRARGAPAAPLETRLRGISTSPPRRRRDFVSAEYPRRRSGDAATSTEYPRRRRGDAATSTEYPRRRDLHGISTSSPRRRRDLRGISTSSRRPRNIHVVAAASPRLLPRGAQDVAQLRDSADCIDRPEPSCGSGTRFMEWRAPPPPLPDASRKLI